MADKVRAACRFPRTLVGSDTYTAMVDVTNVADAPLTDVNVEVQELPGRELAAELPFESELNDLQQKKRRLVKELERQIARAYAGQDPPPRKRMGEIVSQTLAAPFLGYMRLLKMMVNEDSFPSSGPIPDWAREACRIEDWEDLERMEQDVIAREPEDSRIRRFFVIDKQKLRRCMDRLAELEEGEPQQLSLGPSFGIQPGETMSFPFRYRAPRLMRQRSYNTQFRVSFRDSDGLQGTVSLGDELAFFASPFAVPFGAAAGAILGFLVRLLLLDDEIMKWPGWIGTLVGALALAMVVAMLTSRSREQRKAIAVEDWVGGLIIGAITAIYSEEILAYLKQLLPGEGNPPP